MIAKNVAPEAKLDVPEITENPEVVITFYPRSSADGKKENSYFGVFELNGKIIPLSSLNDLPKAIAHYLDNAEIVFTPF